MKAVGDFAWLASAL